MLYSARWNPVWSAIAFCPLLFPFTMAHYILLCLLDGILTESSMESWSLSTKEATLIYVHDVWITCVGKKSLLVSSQVRFWLSISDLYNSRIGQLGHDISSPHRNSQGFQYLNITMPALSGSIEPKTLGSTVFVCIAP